MLELTKQLRNEASAAKPKKSEEQPLPGASKEEKHEERENHVPQAQNGDVPSSSDKTRENAPTHKDNNPVAAEENIPEAKESAQQLEEGSHIPEAKESTQQLDEGSQGTYVIGGSPVGWNFLVYPGSNTIYYGITKASFHSRQTAK